MNIYTTKTSGFISFICMIVLSFHTNAQITFEKIYSSGVSQSGRSIVETADGGYLVAGLTMDNIAGDSNIYISKINSAGANLWSKTYGGSKSDYPYCVVITPDSGYLVVGFTKSYGAGNADTYLMKLDSKGDSVWAKTYGGAGFDEGHAIKATPDGNYVIAGITNSADTSNFNGFLMKITPAGTVMWTQYYGGPKYENINSVALTLDGGYIMTGETYSYGAGLDDMWMVKANSAGDSLWSKVFGGPAEEEGHSISVNSDGTFIIAGETMSFGAGDVDAYIVKTDSLGKTLWAKPYGGAQKDLARSIRQTTDGGYIVGAISRSFGLVNPDMWIMKLNAAGDSVWQKMYGGSGHEHCYNAIQTTDGGYAAVGHSDSYSTWTELMLVKMDPNGNIMPQGIEEQSLLTGISIYPNPVTTSTTFALQLEKTADVTLTILDVTGKEIARYMNSKVPAGSSQLIFNRDMIPSGMYFYQLQIDSSIRGGKIIIE